MVIIVFITTYISSLILFMSRSCCDCALPPRIVDARTILSMPPFCLLSPTMRAIKYYATQDRCSYPHLSVVEICFVTGTTTSKYYRTLNCLKQGIPVGVLGRRPSLSPQELQLVLDRIRFLTEGKQSPSLDAITDYANELRLKRLGDSYSPISKKTVSCLLRKEGMLISVPKTPFEVKAISDQASIRQLYVNIHGLMDAFRYPNWLIFNMDETWVSIDNQYNKKSVLHPKNLPGVSYQSNTGRHISVVGCIAKSGDAVEESFVVPMEVAIAHNMNDSCLERVKIFTSMSGFMNGELLTKWIDEVLGPHIQRKRQYMGQRALLIVDAHASRYNSAALAALERNRIDLLVLPAHVTSMFQPLDVVVYRKFKRGFKNDMLKNRDKSLCSILFSARNAFRIATTPRAIKSAWERSRLFSEDYETVINEQPIRTNAGTLRGISNVVFLCAPP